MSQNIGYDWCKHCGSRIEPITEEVFIHVRNGETKCHTYDRDSPVAEPREREAA